MADEIQNTGIQFEDIVPWVDDHGDTGLSARLKLKRNFDKIKAWMDANHIDVQAVKDLIEEYGADLFLSKINNDEAQGEMGFLDKLPRSGTAVSLSEDTVLEEIDEENFERSFSENTAKMLSLLQQMSMRLRRISRDNADACRTVSDVVEAETAGREKDAALKNRIAKTLAGFEVSRLEDLEEGGTAE